MKLSERYTEPLRVLSYNCMWTYNDLTIKGLILKMERKVKECNKKKRKKTYMKFVFCFLKLVSMCSKLLPVPFAFTTYFQNTVMMYAKPLGGVWTLLTVGYLPWAQQGTVGAEPWVYKNNLILISFKVRRKINKIILNNNIVMSLNNNSHNNDCIIMNPA